ncbi:MAG: hypothetical protein P4M00_25255 [Azospirillaceae bacterium]|nr:hypothetical protein [Azospirillaceae bacterium]
MVQEADNGNALPFILAAVLGLVVVAGSLIVAPALTVVLAVLLAFANLGLLVVLSRG